jgi:hypothetical protein
VVVEVEDEAAGGAADPVQASSEVVEEEGKASGELGMEEGERQWIAAASTSFTRLRSPSSLERDPEVTERLSASASPLFFPPFFFFPKSVCSSFPSFFLFPSFLRYCSSFLFLLLLFPYTLRSLRSRLGGLL